MQESLSEIQHCVWGQAEVSKATLAFKPPRKKCKSWKCCCYLCQPFALCSQYKRPELIHTIAAPSLFWLRSCSFYIDLDFLSFPSKFSPLKQKTKQITPPCLRDSFDSPSQRNWGRNVKETYLNGIIWTQKPIWFKVNDCMNALHVFNNSWAIIPSNCMSLICWILWGNIMENSWSWTRQNLRSEILQI